MGTPMFKKGDRVLIKGNCNYSIGQEELEGKVVTVSGGWADDWFDFTCPGYREGKGTVFRHDYDKVELMNPYRWEPYELKHVNIDPVIGGQNLYGLFTMPHTRPWIPLGLNRDTASSINKPIKKEGFIMNITKQLKDLTLSKGDRLLRTYGIVDDCGGITEDGEEVLLQMLLEDHKEALIAKVTELDKEQKAKK